MAFMDFLFGKKSKTKKKPIYTPDQESLIGQIMGGLSQQLPTGLKNLQNILGGDQQTFQDFFAPARRDFEQKTLPSIAERFTGELGEGSQRSSAFGQQLGQKGKELEQDIFSQRTGMQSNALQQLLSLLAPGLSQRYQSSVSPRGTGMLENLITAAAAGFGGGLTGGASGATGAGLTSLSGMFGK